MLMAPALMQCSAWSVCLCVGAATARCWMQEASAVPVGCWMTVECVMETAPPVRFTLSPLLRSAILSRKTATDEYTHIQEPAQHMANSHLHPSAIYTSCLAVLKFILSQSPRHSELSLPNKPALPLTLSALAPCIVVNALLASIGVHVPGSVIRGRVLGRCCHCLCVSLIFLSLRCTSHSIWLTVWSEHRKQNVLTQTSEDNSLFTSASFIPQQEKLHCMQVLT